MPQMPAKSPRLRLSAIVSFSLRAMLRFQMKIQGNPAKKKSTTMQIANTKVSKPLRKETATGGRKQDHVPPYT